MPSYYYTEFQKNPCVGRNERCPLVETAALDIDGPNPRKCLDIGSIAFN